MANGMMDPTRGIPVSLNFFLNDLKGENSFNKLKIKTFTKQTKTATLAFLDLFWFTAFVKAKN